MMVETWVVKMVLVVNTLGLGLVAGEVTALGLVAGEVTAEVPLV